MPIASPVRTYPLCTICLPTAFVGHPRNSERNSRSTLLESAEKFQRHDLIFSMPQISTPHLLSGCDVISVSDFRTFRLGPVNKFVD